MPIAISIIIPFFNRMEYMPQLVDSIPVRGDIEILIADDKSTADQTQQLKAFVAAQQAHRNIYYFHNDATKSAGACRNIGLRHAVGEWVLFADSDDYFTPDFYETLVPWLQSDCDLVYFTPTSIDRATGKETERHRGFADWVANYLANPTDAAQYRLKGFYVVPWSKLYRRRLLVENGICFDEVLASNDVMCSVKAAFAATKIAACKGTIYCVTKSPGSLIYSVDKAVLDARMGVFIRYYQYLKARVPKPIFKTFLLNGRNTIIAYLAQKQHPAVVLGVVCKLVRGGVPVFEARLLNPARVVRAAKGHLAKHQKNQGYYKTK